MHAEGASVGHTGARETRGRIGARGVASVAVACIIPMCAWAQQPPTIAITSPASAQQVDGPTPSIVVEYSADEAVGIAVETLRVFVNGQDWSARFQPAAAASASYTVAASDRLSAGSAALNIVASIRDKAGEPAEAAASYDMLPSFTAVSPAMGHSGDPTASVRGDIVNVGALGLDADAGNNALRFGGPLGAIDVPFLSVDLDRATGTVEVPENAQTDYVWLVVNGMVSRDAFWFRVQGPLPYC